MDSIDHKIIKQLQQNGRIPMKSLGALVALTPQAAAERVRRLEESQVILGYTALVDSKKLNKDVKAIINITIPPEKQSDFIESARNIENIVCAYHVTGAFSMSVMAVFQDISELEKIILKFQQFGKTQTLIVMATPIPFQGIDRFYGEPFKKL